MTVPLAREIALLPKLTVKQLQVRYAEVFGEATRGNNRTWLVRRIAWRLQAIAEGDLSERARQRAVELARDADLRVIPPKPKPPAEVDGPRILQFGKDGRLPPPGTVLAREYKGETLQVKVLADGFEYAGELYRSLSAVAKAITGSHCNGFLFFKMAGGDR